MTKIGCTKCGHIACVCQIQENHKESCRFRVAATGPVGIECRHGRDTCPICDSCDCGFEEDRTITEWLKTQKCPNALCTATGEFSYGNVRYMAPLLYTATCDVCTFGSDFHGRGMKVVECDEHGKLLRVTRAPPAWR